MRQKKVKEADGGSHAGGSGTVSGVMPPHAAGSSRTISEVQAGRGSPVLRSSHPQQHAAAQTASDSAAAPLVPPPHGGGGRTGWGSSAGPSHPHGSGEEGAPAASERPRQSSKYGIQQMLKPTKEQEVRASDSLSHWCGSEAQHAPEFYDGHGSKIKETSIGSLHTRMVMSFLMVEICVSPTMTPPLLRTCKPM